MDFAILLLILSGLLLVSSAITGNSIQDTARTYIGGK